MGTETVIGILQMGCILIMVLLALGVLIQRILMKKVTGARTIQFLAVGFIFPTILILALGKAIAGETTAALLGGLAGYLLSDIGRYKPGDSSDKCNAADNTKS
jgi:predicted permease